MLNPSRASVLAFRWRRQQLDRPPGSSTAAEVDLLDLGVQDTGPDGAAWALAIRGAEVDAALCGADDLFVAWTLRGAPHAYRRREAAAIAVATAPYSEADAAKRVFDASRPLRNAGIAVLEALAVVADRTRELVDAPTVKGDVSRALSDTLDAPYLRHCRPCNAIHIYEQPLRLAALQAGLELEAGTSPPVLRRIPLLRPNRFAHLAGEADGRYDVVRNYLRFYGPATVKEVATYLDMPARDAKERWPRDVVEVERGRFVLAEDDGALEAGPSATGVVRLLGPYDPYLQTRDREGLVPDAARRSDLWRVLGRPGGVAIDGDVVASWRPRTTSRKLTVVVDPWRALSSMTRDGITAEAERLASFRGVTVAGVEFT